MFMQKIRKKFNGSPKKRKGSFLLEIVVGLLVLGVLYSFISPQVKDYIHASDMTKMQNDMKAIATAAVTYEYWSKDGQPPATIEEMITGVAAADAKDGQDHPNLINLDTEGAEILTPWGDSYGYDPTAREITCTPKNSAGEDLPVVTVPF